jgi:transposase InsO family protein
MPYTTNPKMPSIRKEAAQLVYRGWSTRKVARHFGFNQSTVVRWFKKSKIYGYHPIPTESSRPNHHPKQLSDNLVWKIFHQRIKSKRCAEVIRQEILNQGFVVSLSSVKRTLDRTGLLKKRSPWKRYHPHQERPLALQPGDLVQIDTIHLMVDKEKRIYIYVLIDVYSRSTYCKAYEKINGANSLRFVKEAQRHAGFQFKMLQSDHGPEFGDWFVEQVKKSHRYTRIGKPNDNAHVERFNRTLQEECIDRVSRNVFSLNKALKIYLQHYNNERLHMGINLKTPIQLLTK